MNHFWKQLNLEPNSTQDAILLSWYQLPIEKQNKELRLFVKANLDSYYKTTLEYYPDITTLLAAGFFDDNLQPGFNLHSIDLFTTPISKILKHLTKIKIDIETGCATDKPFLVLLNTGSYSPVHLGHLQMMEEAKEKLSKHYHILGGYLSPSHDNYVSSKYSGTASYHGEARISLCEEVLSDSDWLMVDPWESRYNSEPINFTDVIERLTKYLKHYIKENIQVGYVFGSDNASFSLAFLKKGISICFERPGYELQFKTLSQNSHLNAKRHFFINHVGNTFSSKAIREGNSDFLPEKIKQLYFQYKNNQYPVNSNIYLIRDDSLHCSQSIIDQNLLSSLNVFKQSLCNNIINAFQSYEPMNIYLLDVNQQNTFLNSSFNHKAIINVDLWTQHPKQYTLGLSRLFELSDGQVFSNNLIERPGLDSLPLQIKEIPDNDYTLVDDDIASGKTIKMIMELLPSGININELVALSQQSFHNHLGFDIPYQFHDIIDFRDFLIGSLHGGLVVALPDGNIGRVPYVWPYVSLVHRAKIPHMEQKEFSYKIWTMNKEFYSSLEKTLIIKDMDEYFVAFCISIGFSTSLSMTDFCQYHLER